MKRPHIVLIGLMGTGKTTIGKRLARDLGREFVDTDALVEKRAGKSVRDVFVEDGESAFRDIEAEVVADVVGRDEPSVIAAAGGAVLRATNREHIKGCETVVWLDAPTSLLVKRTSNRAGRGHRPLIDVDPASRLDALRLEREQVYRDTSTDRVDVEGLGIDEVVRRIVDIRNAAAEVAK